MQLCVAYPAAPLSTSRPAHSRLRAHTYLCGLHAAVQLATSSWLANGSQLWGSPQLGHCWAQGVRLWCCTLTSGQILRNMQCAHDILQLYVLSAYNNTHEPRLYMKQKWLSKPHISPTQRYARGQTRVKLGPPAVVFSAHDNDGTYMVIMLNATSALIF
jgi:hypothetical protein